MTLFAAIAVPARLRAATDGRAWLEGMLAAEAALARAEAQAGVIPAEAAEAIGQACDAESFDLEQLAEQGRAVGNPVEPLVRALRDQVGGDAARHVHRGATSQDILDTAAMLVVRRALPLVLAELDRIAAACARHAREQRGAVMAARTLLGQAVPTTFGLKAAGWLVGVLEARRELASVPLAAQLGGAAGTLAALGDHGPEVARLFAAELELPEPPLPWHTNRVRIARLGSGLAIAAGASAKIGLDVALLSQTEVAEVRPPSGGVSSTMPQKQNPTGSALAVACARLVAADAGVLTGSLVQEHERGLGGWHAEWDALSRALALTGGAAAAVAELLEGLAVDAARMRANIADETLSERAVVELGLDREALAGRPLREALAETLSGEELEAALDPAAYLGSSEAFVDRALALYDEERA